MIEIPSFPELTFEEESHIYRLNGTEIPSVTTLMNPLSSSFYKTVDPAVLERAARRGTAVHNANENYALYGIEDISPAYAGYFAGFKEWWDKTQPVLLATESRVYHKILGYAGTEDLLCLINDRVTMIDYKTSASVNQMLCGVQLEGYDRAFESHGIKVDDRFILHRARDGPYKLIRFERSPKCWSVLAALLTVHNYINEF